MASLYRWLLGSLIEQKNAGNAGVLFTLRDSIRYQYFGTLLSTSFDQASMPPVML